LTLLEKKVESQKFACISYLAHVGSIFNHDQPVGRDYQVYSAVRPVIDGMLWAGFKVFMRSRIRQILLKTFLRVVLPLLVFILAAPQAARAECGDYVVIPSQGTAPGGPMSLKHMPAHSPHSPLDAPCSGPNCSRRSLPPMPSPVSTSQHGGDDWGWMPCGAHQALIFSSPSSFSVALLAPVHRGLDIYHPPR
jgi:hypothetical protein